MILPILNHRLDKYANSKTPDCDKCYHGYSLLGIIDNAEIVKAWLTVNQDSEVVSSFTLSLNHMASFSGDGNAIWDDIGNGTNYGSFSADETLNNPVFDEEYTDEKEIKFARISKMHWKMIGLE